MSRRMKLIVGLGNPGLLYAGSRHNIGFAVVKSVARGQRAALKKDRSVYAYSAKCRINQEELLLAMPLTFMNSSGLAVKALIRKYRVALGDLLVVCDDLDLDLGRIKLRAAGSSAGHRGLQSIIDNLGTKDFSRLRLGIGRPTGQAGTTNYVLSGFRRREMKFVEEMKEKAASCCLMWIEKGTGETMNVFNTRSKNE